MDFGRIFTTALLQGGRGLPLGRRWAAFGAGSRHDDRLSSMSGRRDDYGYNRHMRKGLPP